MKSRDDMSAVIKGLHKDHGLLAAFLEAAHNLDCRASHRLVTTSEISKPINVEAHDATAAAVPPQAASLNPAASPLIFRRANLVRDSE
jgi:hypothetical protein